MSRKEKRTDEGVYMERGGGRVQGQEKEQRRARSPGGGRPVGTSPVGPRRPATRHHLIDRFDLVHHSRFVFTSLLVLSRILLARRSPCERASSLAVLSPRSSQHSTAHTRLRLPEMSRALGLASVSFLPSNRLASPTGHPVHCPAPPRRFVDFAVSFLTTPTTCLRPRARHHAGKASANRALRGAQLNCNRASAGEDTLPACFPPPTG